jgi:putative endonuclease
MGEYAYVYILANGFEKLYIDITTTLEIRVQQHKEKKDPDCHTARYNINRLVYFERFTTTSAAIAREKQLKRLAPYSQTRADYFYQSDVG